MTVAQLIGKLQQFPQNLQVVTSDDLGDGFNFYAENAVRVCQVTEDEMEESLDGDMVSIIP